MYAKKIAALGLFEDKVPNHVLVNEYEAGQGIMVTLRKHVRAIYCKIS